MNDKEFYAQTEKYFEALSRAMETHDADFVQTDSGVFEIEFDNADRIVVNRHAPSHELWVAARSGAHRFRWNGEDWIETRSGETIGTAISRLIFERSGIAVSLD
jgi:CyaY protein